MSEAKFTKGEWIVNITNCNVMVKIKKGFGVIVGVFNNEENRANAHLIASAPDMYEMLKFLLESDSINSYEFDERVEKLLAKARGEQ